MICSYQKEYAKEIGEAHQKFYSTRERVEKITSPHLYEEPFKRPLTIPSGDVPSPSASSRDSSKLSAKPPFKLNLPESVLVPLSSSDKESSSEPLKKKKRLARRVSSQASLSELETEKVLEEIEDLSSSNKEK
jgi:hypothetical protein